MKKSGFLYDYVLCIRRSRHGIFSWCYLGRGLSETTVEFGINDNVLGASSTDVGICKSLIPHELVGYDLVGYDLV